MTYHARARRLLKRAQLCVPKSTRLISLVSRRITGTLSPRLVNLFSSIYYEAVQAPPPSNRTLRALQIRFDFFMIHCTLDLLFDKPESDQFDNAMRFLLRIMSAKSRVVSADLFFSDPSKSISQGLDHILLLKYPFAFGSRNM